MTYDRIEYGLDSRLVFGCSQQREEFISDMRCHISGGFCVSIALFGLRHLLRRSIFLATGFLEGVNVIPG